jgi:hypothetical protein
LSDDTRKPQAYDWLLRRPFAPPPSAPPNPYQAPTAAAKAGPPVSAYAASLPVIGGRRFQPIGDDASYRSQRNAAKAANSAEIGAGRRDEIDLVVPTDGGRAAVRRDLTRAQAASALNSLVASGLLRDRVSVSAVISANGLASVLAVDAAGRVVVAPTP